MKPTLKITRANFPGFGNFSWMNFFVDILNIKYNVVIDSINPDVVIYTNQYYQEGTLDYYTNNTIKGIHEYNEDVKKIFISGEARPDYISHLNCSNNIYALGYEHIEHKNYLRFPTYVLDAFVLHNEGGMFSSPYEWMLDNNKNVEEILNNKKHFCSVVQASHNEDREKIFNLIESKHYIKSSGPWKGTVTGSDQLLPHKYHDYSNKDYMGRIDGLAYRDKVKFFSDCMFNIAFQYTDTDYLTQEKIIHAYASNSIPLFYGNRYIEEEGFNPNSFINCHNYENFNHVFEYIEDLYNNKNKLKQYFKEPFFIDNKLPIYFNKEYILDFFTTVINN